MKQSTFISKLILLGWTQTHIDFRLLIPAKSFKPHFLIGIDKNKKANFINLEFQEQDIPYRKLLNKHKSFKKTFKLVLKYTE